MHRNIRRNMGYDDPKVNELSRDAQRALDSVYDITIHKATVVWNPPFNLSVPFFGGDPRLTSPELVECPRARNLTDPTILVTPGAGCAWEWVGNNNVRIDDVSGLTVGEKYELTFRVTG